MLVDWPTYQSYGGSIVHSRAIPYRDFPVEYPPRSLPVFVLPSLIGGTYATTFEWVMAVCGVALVVVVAWLRPHAALYVALAPVLVGSLILSRFDLWPALLATAALAALVRDRHPLGWALLQRRSPRSSGHSCSCRPRSSGRTAGVTCARCSPAQSCSYSSSVRSS